MGSVYTQDHLLNDEELKAFQLRCFNAPLAPEELTAVKQVVADKVPQGITADGSLTFHGFLFLHALFIERGRTETPWAVLRTYGYDNYLKLSDEVLDAVNFRRGNDQVRGGRGDGGGGGGGGGGNAVVCHAYAHQQACPSNTLHTHYKHYTHTPRTLHTATYTTTHTTHTLHTHYTPLHTLHTQNTPR